MTHPFNPPARGEPYLLTPGPLTTALAVKDEMLRDWGSWDGDFRAMTAALRNGVLDLIGDGREAYDCVPVQGSGTFAVEAMLGSFVPRDGKVLVLANGAYGLRAAETLAYLGRAHIVLDKGDYLPPRGAEVAALLSENPDISHVVAVHCETSSGILNPLDEIADAVLSAGRKLLIDAMSSFGAIPLEVASLPFHAMVSSANKCIEGVPGFGFVVARRDELEAAKGNSHSLSLDLHAQWAVMNKTGQWRYTPPTHVVAAFLKALDLHRAEGGVSGRGGALCRQPRHSGRGDARVGVRDPARQPLAVADHRHVLLSRRPGIRLRRLLRGHEIARLHHLSRQADRGGQLPRGLHRPSGQVRDGACRRRRQGDARRHGRDQRRAA